MAGENVVGSVRVLRKRQMSQSQSQKWRVLRKRSSMAGENVVGSVRVLRKRQMSQSQKWRG
jgi:hypothetical protein